MTWHLYWEHTVLLAEDARGSCIEHIVPVDRADAEQIMAALAQPLLATRCRRAALGRERLPGVIHLARKLQGESD
jgi:hypothetical protein